MPVMRGQRELGECAAWTLHAPIACTQVKLKLVRVQYCLVQYETLTCAFMEEAKLSLFLGRSWQKYGFLWKNRVLKFLPLTFFHTLWW